MTRRLAALIWGVRVAGLGLGVADFANQDAEQMPFVSLKRVFKRDRAVA